MEVIDNELKRYDSMQTELESLKKSFDNLNTNDKEKDQSKSADGLETIMNEEKPKEVCQVSHFHEDFFLNIFSYLLRPILI